MRSFYSMILSICLFSPLCFATDLIIKNGNIITLKGEERVKAMAVKDGRIIAVGSEKDMETHKTTKTKILDLKGATAIPGFIDGHAHFVGIGNTAMNLRLMTIPNWDHAIEMVAKAAQDTPKGSWIQGRGWHQDKWNKVPPGSVEGYPVHKRLSAVSPDHPVILTHASGHALFANAKAMELAGVDANTPDPSGGKIVRDSQGNPIGVFEENAMGLIRAELRRAESTMTTAQKRARTVKAIKLAQEECLSKGLTSFHDAGSTFNQLDIFKDLAEKDELHLRLWVMAGEDNASLAKNLENYRWKNLSNHMLTLGGIKRYMDGALGSRGAWLLKEYSDLPNHFGQKVISLETLEETARIAKKFDLQLCTHAIGDKGNRVVLDMYEKVLKGDDRRWRIEHAQHVDPEDIPRFAKLGVIASMQGVHCTSDAPFVPKRLGDKRAEEGAYMWKALLESGAVVTNGTDAPVEDVSPIATYYSMVSRKGKSGNTFYPKQALSRMEALRASTLSNAYASFQEKDKGSLEVGKLADLTVLSQDITKIATDDIPKTQVLKTIVGGKIRYQR